MTSPDFSVLLLAWDDADPAVLVLGGAALPPTLPLVYQLAARQPVLALYPHLPAGEAPAALESAASGGGAPNKAEEAVVAATASAGASATGAAAAAAAPAVPGPLGAVADGPGVRLLPAAPPDGRGTSAAPAGGSRMVGLAELRPAILDALPTAHSLVLAPGAAPGAAEPFAAPPAPARNQWPTGSGPLRTGGWLAPAAPYAGAAGPAKAASMPAYATARPAFPPPPPRPAATAAAPPAAGATANAPALPATPATPAATAARAAQAASAANAAAGLPLTPTVPAAFDELVAEMGAAEARDLDAPADDLVPDPTPLPAALAAAPEAALPVAPEAAAAAPEPAATWALRQPALDGLNSRMIQYARQAAQLMDGRRDFGVIYAPGWPAWLAALEIRNRSERPLVLYAAGLASDTAPAAERGWLLGLERMVLRRAALVLVPDAEALRLLRARHADAQAEIRVVPAADEAAVQRVLAAVARS